MQLDMAEMEERSFIDGDFGVDRLAGWHLVEFLGKTRIVDVGAVDRDGDLGLVIAEGLQHGLDAVVIVLAASHERERPGWRLFLKRLKLRRVAQRGIERL